MQLGIDIGTSSIKLVVVAGSKLQLAQVVSNPLGRVAIENEDEMVKMVEQIKKGLGDVKLRNQQTQVVISESVVNSKVISMPVLSKAELSTAIKWEAEQYVPVPLDTVEMSWQVVERSDSSDKMRVYLVAVDKKIVRGVVDLCSRIGLEPIGIRPELISASKLVGGDGGVMVLAMGASSTSCGVYNDGKLIFVYDFSSGGEALTRAIASGLQFDLKQAEKYKRSYGLRTDVLEGRLYKTMQPVVENILSELKKVMSYYQENFSQGGKLSRVVLSGGVVLMPGLLGLLGSELGVGVEMIEGFSTVRNEVGIDENFKVLYAPVIGAMSD